MDYPTTKEKKHISHDYPSHLSLENTISVEPGSVRAVHGDLVAAQGHPSVLRKNFSTLASLGLGFSITNSWIGYVVSFGTNVIYGGPQEAILGLLVVTFIQFFITLGLSELASAFPSAGGQYHFVYLLAPAKWKRVIAFMVGWLSIIGWWVLTCSGISLAAVSISGMVVFWFPDFTSHAWSLYLIYLAVIASAAIPIYLAHNSGHLFTQFGLAASILGAALTLIVVLAMKQQTQPASFVFASNMGSCGWSQRYAYVATDAAIHIIPEEMLRPSSQIPFILNTTINIG